PHASTASKCCCPSYSIATPAARKSMNSGRRFWAYLIGYCELYEIPADSRNDATAFSPFDSMHLGHLLPFKNPLGVTEYSCPQILCLTQILVADVLYSSKNTYSSPTSA